MVVDGIKLLAMIKDGQIEKNKDEVYLISDDKKTKIYLKWFCQGLRVGEHDLTMFEIMNFKFEILSNEDKEKETDIQSITCFDEIRDISTWSNETLSHNQRSIISKVNNLVKAIKQLDKKIK